MFSLRFLIIFIALAASSVYADRKVVCFVTAWSAQRSGDGKFTVLDSDTERCTHVVYAHLGLNEMTSEIMSIYPFVDTSLDGNGEHSLAKLKQLKLSNPKLKVMVSIGGWDQMSKRFSDLAKDPIKRAKFLYSVLHFLKEYELDGVDMCWRYPTLRGGKREDKENTVILFREIKHAFKEYGYILSVHIFGTQFTMDAYNIREVSEIVDFINLMAIEYNGPWTRTTAIFAPLKSQDNNNVIFSIEYMIMKGAPRKKLVLGVGSHGHAYLLEEPPKNGNQLLGQYAPDTFKSPWTDHGGTIAYNEYCLEVTTSANWTVLWHEESQTPIAYNGRKFVTIENGTSLLKKVELVASKSLGGVGLWTLDMDDFRGLCNVTYPLLSTIADYVQELPEEPDAPQEQEEEVKEETQEEKEEEPIYDDYVTEETTKVQFQSKTTEAPANNLIRRSDGVRVRWSNILVFIALIISAT